MKYVLKTYQPMFEMIRLIFCRMSSPKFCYAKTKIEIISKFSFIIGQKNIQYANSNVPKISSTKKCTLLSLRELKSQCIVSISTLSALILFFINLLIYDRDFLALRMHCPLLNLLCKIIVLIES